MKKLLIDYSYKAKYLSLQICVRKTCTLNTKKCNAIFDTGANRSAITPKVFKELGFLQMGQTRLSGVESQKVVFTTIADFILPKDIFFKELKVIVCKLPEGVDALIGLDILTQCDFLLTNVNKTVLQLRSPAIADGVCL